MSKANSPIKVLRTALKRVQKGWTKQTWHAHSNGVNYVCLEGAVYGYCNDGKHGATIAQSKAIKVLEDIIAERTGFHAIPAYNDAPERTQDEIEEVIKLGIIRLETGGDMDDQEFEDLLEFKNSK
jgi:hypothetical protein